jgi:hypothetical protein
LVVTEAGEGHVVAEEYVSWVGEHEYKGAVVRRVAVLVVGGADDVVGSWT